MSGIAKVGMPKWGLSMTEGKLIEWLVDAGGRRLRCLATGDGDGVPVVFAHGFGGDLNNWLFNVETLSSGRMAYAIDLPGHGESDKQVSGFTDLVSALDGFLRGQGIDRAHLVGHSMGGAVVLRFAADNPDRVASLTLIDSAGLGPEINGGYVAGFIAADRRRDLKSVLQSLFADASLVTRQMVDDVLKYKRKDGVDAALRTLAGDMFSAARSRWICGPPWRTLTCRCSSSGARRTR